MRKQTKIKHTFNCRNYFLEDWSGSEIAKLQVLSSINERDWEITVDSFVFDNCISAKARSIYLTQRRNEGSYFKGAGNTTQFMYKRKNQETFHSFSVVFCCVCLKESGRLFGEFIDEIEVYVDLLNTNRQWDNSICTKKRDYPIYKKMTGDLKKCNTCLICKKLPGPIRVYDLDVIWTDNCVA